MHVANLLTSWDTLLLIAPFLGLLILWIFGLDERVAAPKVRTTRRSFCQADGPGTPYFYDPDGRQLTSLFRSPEEQNSSRLKGRKRMLRGKIDVAETIGDASLLRPSAPELCQHR